MVSSEPLKYHRFMVEVMNICCHDISTSVDYEFLRARLRGIFPSTTLSRAEAKRASCDIMIELCDHAKRLSFEDFSHFVCAIDVDYPDVAEKIREKFHELSNHQLPNTKQKLAAAVEQTPVICKYDEQQQKWQNSNSSSENSLSSISPSLESQAKATAPGIDSNRTNQPATPNAKAIGPTSSLGRQQSEEYPMNTRPRGLALIINNVNFDHFSQRRGSNEDMRMIFNMFKKLDFQVTMESDKTGKQMKQLLENFAKYEPLKSVSALSVVLLSHGTDNDCIFGIDGSLRGDEPVKGTFISKFELGQFFTAKNCPSMAQKPKLFIIQACRGNVEDAPITDMQPSNPNRLTHDAPNSHTRGDFLQSDSPSNRPRVADTADMCFVHSSSLGYKAYRAVTNGSPFIKTFTETVEEHAGRLHFLEIIQKVQGSFGTQALTNHMMTMPDCSTQLLKKWYLLPSHP
ncbi:unnamed protein product [Lymnaea stagnalis]|uniref:Uncharacterized protein n=1 Tax=Lymnaea stagnalis TaxID=6523 RepID=A0AAV2H4S0_LYMST